MIPSEAEALELHRKAGSNERTIQHCLHVRRIARVIAEAFRQRGETIDEQSIYAAALLHDIGRSRTNTVHHGHVGAELLREMGVDQSVSRIVSCHVGAGISGDEARNFGFPSGDFIPRTLEEIVVCFSDKIVDGRGQVSPFKDEVERFRKKGLDAERLLTLKALLEKALGQDPEILVLRSISK